MTPSKLQEDSSFARFNITSEFPTDGKGEKNWLCIHREDRALGWVTHATFDPNRFYNLKDLEFGCDFIHKPEYILMKKILVTKCHEEKGKLLRSTLAGLSFRVTQVSEEKLLEMKNVEPNEREYIKILKEVFGIEITEEENKKNPLNLFLSLKSDEEIYSSI